MENTGEISSAKQELKILHPIGERVLGLVDLVFFSRQEFEQSPDLLWHGSKKELNYDSSFDIVNNDESDYGTTLGVGFYATDSKQEAELFSKHRLKDSLSKPVITAVLPYHAQMFDFRSTDDPLQNAPVSQQMAEEFLDYFKEFLSRPNSPQGLLKDINEDYVDQTTERVVAHIPLRIRQLLSPSARENNVYGYAAGIFTKYMLDCGFDGVIAIEGGDHPDQKDPTSFVFYNLSKVGTYDSWHKENNPIV